MKKQLLFALILPVVIFVSSCNSKGGDKKSDKTTFSTAIEYNDFIVKLQEKTILKTLALGDVLKGGDSASIHKSFKEFGDQAKASLAELKKLDAFEGEVELRDKALELFQFYVTIYEKDYKEMIDLVTKKDVNEKDLARVDAIVAKVSTEELKYDAGFAAAQDAFAKKHNMTIIKNNLQNEIDKQ